VGCAYVFTLIATVVPSRFSSIAPWLGGLGSGLPTGRITTSGYDPFRPEPPGRVSCESGSGWGRIKTSAEKSDGLDVTVTILESTVLVTFTAVIGVVPSA